MQLKSRPTLRGRKRYIFFRIHCEKPLGFINVRGALLNSMLCWAGEKGYSKAGIKVIQNLWRPLRKMGVIRCSHTSVDDVKAALALVHQIGDERVVFQTLRVSGTIKSGTEKLG